MSFVASKRAAAQQVDTRNGSVKPPGNTAAAPMSNVPGSDSLSAGHHMPRGASARARPTMSHAHRATTHHRELTEIVGNEGKLYTSDSGADIELSDPTPVPGLGVWSALVVMFLLAFACRRLHKAKHTAHHDSLLPL